MAELEVNQLELVENSGLNEVCIIILGNTTIEVGLQFSIISLGNTATEIDFQSINEIFFLYNSTCFSLVSILDDGLVENNETFSVSLVSGDSRLTLLHNGSLANITIIDDDCKLGNYNAAKMHPICSHMQLHYYSVLFMLVLFHRQHW